MNNLTLHLKKLEKEEQTVATSQARAGNRKDSVQTISAVNGPRSSQGGDLGGDSCTEEGHEAQAGGNS